MLGWRCQGAEAECIFKAPAPIPCHRHWERLNEICGQELPAPSNGLLLRDLLAADLPKHRQNCGGGSWECPRL